MKRAGRMLDRTHNPAGHSTSGSANVLINGRPALRVRDGGIQGPDQRKWQAFHGAPAVLINDRLAHRQLDATIHRKERGVLLDGSPNVLIGDHFVRGGLPLPPATVVFVLKNHEGLPLPWVKCKVLWPDGTRTEEESDDAGRITMSDVPQGTYSLEIDPNFHVIREHSRPLTPPQK